MIRNFTFALLGILVGLGIFTYGITAKKRPAPVATTAASTTVGGQRVDEIQRNVIIDPVEIKNPNEDIAAQTAATTTTTAAANSQVGATQTSQAAAQNQQQAINPNVQGQANAGVTTGQVQPGTSLASEIIPVPPTPEPELDEGWANSAFIPSDAYDVENSVLEEEVVQ
jgi:hypothetical protein